MVAIETASQQDPQQPIPDLNPFSIDPLIFGRLHKRHLQTSTVSISLAVIVVVLVSWTALYSGLFFQTSTPSGWWNDLLSFIFRRPGDVHNTQMPYLRDYPSIVLTVTITTSIALVYGLYRSAAVLHTEMRRTSCIKYTTEGELALRSAVKEMNAEFARWGKAAPIALLLSLGFTVAVNLRLQHTLFRFLQPGNLYEQWWAGMVPFHPGAVAWVIIGALGIYVVYAEAVLGITYVRFLRKCSEAYQFRANMLNPDGFWGWAKLRQIVSNLQVGVLCTLLSSWAMSFFLQPAIGSVASAAIILLFTSIVLYVFVQVGVNFRRQARRDKQRLRADIATEVLSSQDKVDTPNLLKLLVNYQRLELIARIPSTPLRQRWLVAGAVSIIGPISAIIVQLIKYFTPP